MDEFKKMTKEEIDTLNKEIYPFHDQETVDSSKFKYGEHGPCLTCKRCRCCGEKKTNPRYYSPYGLRL